MEEPTSSADITMTDPPPPPTGPHTKRKRQDRRSQWARRDINYSETEYYQDGAYVPRLFDTTSSCGEVTHSTTSADARGTVPMEDDISHDLRCGNTHYYLPSSATPIQTDREVTHTTEFVVDCEDMETTDTQKPFLRGSGDSNISFQNSIRSNLQKPTQPQANPNFSGYRIKDILEIPQIQNLNVVQKVSLNNLIGPAEMFTDSINRVLIVSCILLASVQDDLLENCEQESYDFML